MICLYHNDLDGYCAGAIVHSLCPECKMIEIDYNRQLDFSIIEPDERIIIVDFSLQKEEEWKKLYSITEKIIWIDHHKTSLERSKQWKVNNKIPLSNLDGIRDISKSGCELTWEYFYIDVDMPEIVKLIGDWDTWQFKYENTKTFHYGLGIENTDPSTIEGQQFWKEAFDILLYDQPFNIENIIEHGKILMKSKEVSSKWILKSLAFYADFEGYRCICCNSGGNSEFFNSIDPDTFDIMIPFRFDGDQWGVSLYTKKDIDVSDIAKKYGGGGHSKAAGFQCKKLPFEKNKKVNNIKPIDKKMKNKIIDILAKLSKKWQVK